MVTIGVAAFGRRCADAAGGQKMEETVYLYIDGGYLRGLYRDIVEPIFGDTLSVNYESVKNHFGARRVFYYDCLDNVQREGEKDSEFQSRLAQQQAGFDEIDRVPGIHVRYGWLSPGKRRQQKEVDVLLAVDMLTHSFYRNLTKAVLLAGDRDFRPVVESVVKLGTYVEVAFDPRSGQKDLGKAADVETAISLPILCQWVKFEDYTDRFKTFPTENLYRNENSCPVMRFNPPPTLLRIGHAGARKLPVRLYDIQGTHHASVNPAPRDYWVYAFKDGPRLIAFLEAVYGEIRWDTMADNASLAGA